MNGDTRTILGPIKQLKFGAKNRQGEQNSERKSSLKNQRV
jgi:hypothetical protein